MNTYSQKLRSPKWQKRRLEILQRDNFTCTACGDDESNLQIHHLYYLPKTDPWEYQSDAMVTLCGVCHTRLTYLLPKLMVKLGNPDHVEKWINMINTGDPDQESYKVAFRAALSIAALRDAIMTTDIMAAVRGIRQFIKDASGIIAKLPINYQHAP